MSHSFSDFWAVIEDSRKSEAPSAPKRELLAALSRLEPAALVDFGAWSLLATRLHSNKNPMRALGALLCRGDDSDECYERFRAWLVLQGQERWELALREPDRLPESISLPAVANGYADCVAEAFAPHLSAYLRAHDEDGDEDYWGLAEQRLLSRAFRRATDRVWAAFKDLFPDEDPMYARVGADYVATTLPRLWSLFGPQWAGAARTQSYEELYPEHYSATAEDLEYDRRAEEIEKILAARIEGECRVEFEVEDRGLDELAFDGKVLFRAKSDPHNPRSRDFTSEVMDSPTWLEVAILANQMLLVTDDEDHRFLEGLEVVSTGEVAEAEFVMGS